MKLRSFPHSCILPVRTSRALRLCAPLVVAVAAIVSALPALSADATWSGTTNNDWGNAGNWVGGSVPGAASGTTNSDTATFTGNPTNKTPVVDTGRNLGSLSFNGATGTFNIGASTGVGTTTLLMSNGGAISSTASTAAQNVRAPLSLQGTAFTLSNDSTTAAAVLRIGDAGDTTSSSTVISGVSGNVVLTLGGSHAGTGTTISLQNKVNGVISDGTATSLSMLKTGTGSWTLQGGNTFTGTTTISNGTLRWASTGSFGTGTSAVVLGDGNTGAGNVALLSSASSLNLTRAITVSNQGTGSATIGTDGGSVTITYSGQVTMNRDTTLQAGNSGGTTFNGKLTGNGNVTATSVGGARTMTFGGAGGANDFAGNLTVGTDLTLRLGTSGVEYIPNASNVTVNGNLRLNTTTANGTETISGLNGNGIVDTSSVGAKVLVVGSNDGSGSFSGSLQNGTGTLGLTKTGTGTQTLSGVNTYTGATSINAGSMIVNGSLGNSAVNVAAGADLGGSGSISGPVTINGSLSPGNSPGVLTVDNDLTLNTGSSFVFELTGNTSLGRGSSFDGVNVNVGGLTIQSGVAADLVFDLAGSTVDWSNAFWASNQSWLVFDNANAATVSGSIFSAVNAGLDAQGDALATVRPGSTFSFTQSGNDIVLSYTAVPEPSLASFLVFGLALLVVSTRRRSNQVRF